jgi:hypothetical protein
VPSLLSTAILSAGEELLFLVLPFSCRRYLADCYGSYWYALCWPVVRWLWYRNSSRDCASTPGRDLSCQHQRYYNFIATGHVGRWRVGHQLDWLWVLYAMAKHWNLCSVEDTISSVTDKNRIVALLTNGQSRVTNVPRNWTRSLYLSLPRVSKMAVDHGRSEEGLETLAQLHANGDTEGPYGQAEYSIIRCKLRMGTKMLPNHTLSVTKRNRCF